MHGHAAQLGVLDDIVARHEVDELGAELPGETVRQLVFLVGLALVADQPAQAHAAGIGVFQNALGDVVGRIHGHHLAGHDDVDFLRLVLADRHGEAAANHVAEHVVGDVINAFVSAVLLEEVDRGDDAAASAANSGLRSAELDAANVVDSRPSSRLRVRDPRRCRLPPRGSEWCPAPWREGSGGSKSALGSQPTMRIFWPISASAARVF